MSLFDAIVSNLMAANPSANASYQSVLMLRRMRDPRLRAHAVGCCIVSKKPGPELVVYMDSPLWAQEFQLNAPAVLAEWNHVCSTRCPSMRVRSVKFAVSTRVHAATLPGDDARTDIYEPAQLPALTAEEELAVEEMVSVITDERVRERAKSAMMSSLRWEKSNIS